MLSASFGRVIFAESFLERNSWVPEVIGGALIALVSGLVGWYVRQREKDSKHLDYRISSDIPIFSSRDRPIHLNVTYFDEPVTDPRITHVRFKNTGKQVIRPSDIIDEYEVSRGSAKLLDGRLIGGSESGLAQLQGDRATNKLAIKPNTLNAGDWFEVRLIYDGGADDKLTVSGRIDGQTRRTAIYPSREQLRATRELFTWTFGTFGAFFVLLGALIFVMNYRPESHPVGLIFIGAGIVIVMLGVVLSFRSRRRLYARLQAGTQITEPD